MKVTAKTHILARIQKSAFYLLLFLFVALVAQLSIRFNQTFDWTANSRNTLSQTTQQLLSELESDINIQIFVSDSYSYRASLEDLITRYQTYSNKLKISYIDPKFSPELVRSMNIQRQGEIVISQGDRQEHVFDLSEQSFTNALMSVSRKKVPWLVFIEGHGERSLFDQNSYSLSTWYSQLTNKGFKVQAINLIEQNQIPTNTSVLVIASPQFDWLPGEIDIVKSYIQQGGNLLWLAEPNQPKTLNALAESLGIEISSGTVLDPNSVMLGTDDPRFVLVSDYANHPIGVATASVSLFAESTAVTPLNTQIAKDWQYLKLLNSQPDAWVENTQPIPSSLQQASYDEGIDILGPISLAYALNKFVEGSDKEQRIVVIGDGDFVSNAYIGNGANLQLAMATTNWLNLDDNLITIPVKTNIGSQLTLTETQSAIIGFGFLLVLPATTFLVGFVIWWRRRQR